ncbi:MAG: site-2 protease family protein [Bacteroidota bacterium]
MRGTYKIATLFGIPIQIHWSFGLILIWTIFSSYSDGRSMTETIWLNLLVLALFICVVMHEYGHALTARRFGVKTRDIILLPIGGVARLERLPEKPMHEFLVAIAGPAVNIIIAIVFFLGYFLWHNQASIFQVINYENGAFLSNTFIPYLIGMNVFLAIFNLIPAFPMDGGRVLRALLATKLDRLKATQVASIIGQVFAVLFILASIFLPAFKSPMFTLLGIFIFFVARQENRALKQERRLKDTLISDLYRQDFTRLEPHDTIRTAITVSNIKKERDFLVFNDREQVVGMLHALFMKEAEEQNDLEAPVMLYMTQLFDYVKITDSVLHVFKKMQANSYAILPVVEEGKIVGVIDRTIMEGFLNGKTKKS